MFLSKLKIKHKYKFFKKIARGRNNKGRITVRYRGGGHKRLQRKIDWNFNLNGSILVGLQYNPKFKLSLYEWYNLKTLNYFYTPGISNHYILDNNLNKKGYFLQNYQIHDKINNLSLNTNNLRPKYLKSAGTYGIVLQRYTWVKNYMLIKLSSGEQKLFNKAEFCLPSSLIDKTNKNQKLNKAGRKRWLGRKSSVRGVAMNPIDHPHGGGEGKTSGGRPSVSPLGRLTKHVKTRKKRSNSWMIFLKK